MGRPTLDWIGDPINALMNFAVNPWIKKASLTKMVKPAEFLA